MSNASLSQVYNRLNGVAQYHPFTATTFADWASEAGDTVTISREGTSYSAPVHKQSLVWRGKHEISMESTGTRERTAIERISNTKETTTSSGVSSSRAVTGGVGSAVEGLEYNFYSEDGMYQSQLHMDEERFTTIFAKTGINDMGEDETMYTLINQNAEQITLEAHRAIIAENGLETDYNAKFTVQANAINAEVTRATTAEGTLSGRITVEAGKITQIVSAIGTNGEVTAASIVLAINEAGESEARIDANKVYIGNQKSTTVINGKLNASDLTAQRITSLLGSVARLDVNGLNVIGDAYIRNASGNQQNVSAGIWDLNILQSGNTYTLQRKRFQDSNWTDVGSFSRAVSSWSVGGGSGKVNVTANPQNQTKSVPVSIGGSNSISSNGTYTYKVYYENADGDDVETGASMDVAVNIMTAITSWSVTGGNGAVRVTAQPQNQGKSVNLAVSGPGSITSNGTYTYKAMYEDNDGDDSDSGAFRNVTVNVPTGGIYVDEVDLTEIAVSVDQPTGYDNAVYLTQLPNAIKNNHNTNVWFKVRVYDNEGTKLYTKNYYCASA